MTSTDGFLQPRRPNPRTPRLNSAGGKLQPSAGDPTLRYRTTSYRPQQQPVAQPNRDAVRRSPAAARSMGRQAAEGAYANQAGAASTAAASSGTGAFEYDELPEPKYTPPTSSAPPPPNGPSGPSAPAVPAGKRVKKHRSKKKIFLIICLIIFIPLLIYGGYAGFKALRATSKVFKGNVLHALLNSGKELKKDQYGRSNILLFGTSEDDPGHPGGNLTDSIMIISLDQTKHNAFLMSVPRDLWVKYGEQCPAGYNGKINAYYMCVSNDGKDETEGQDKMRQLVGGIYGINLQYSAHINYEVVRNSIDALKGVEITIDSPDPRGIYDRNFDWRCKYKCSLVKYPNGPAHLDGEHALYLAQARGEGVGYGLPRGNFDREANQRKIMIAAKDKANSLGFLANPSSILKVVDSLGDNVRTNIDADEIKTFIKVGKDTDSKNIDSISLVDLKPPALTTGPSPDGTTSSVLPVAGAYDYSGIQDIVKALLLGKGGLLKENAAVDVYNASGVTGVARKQANNLSDKGIIIGTVGSLEAGNYGKFKLYDVSKGTKPNTKAELEKALGVKVTADPLPPAIITDASFVLVVGQDPDAAASNGASSTGN